MMNRIYTLLLLYLIVCTGCGYHFAPAGEHFDKSIRTVYVDTFSNLTGEANIETYLRNGLISEFRTGERFTLVYDRDAADVVLSGSITGVAVSHLSYAKNDIAKEDRVAMTVSATLAKTGTDEVLWENKSLSGREAYRVATDPAITDRNKKEALKKLCTDLAEWAYRDLMAGF
ncbi:MAG: LptE family protein [Deltaproteobacteria bacterium]|nr:LptE family protein [Deltaproteobacteria bacterium]